MPPKVVNAKVEFLRKCGYHDLQEWMRNPKHLYIGRNMVYVSAPASKWKNPFTVQKYGRDECLKMYEDHVRNGSLWNDLEELQDLDELACWCHPEPCHGDILLKLLAEKLKKEADGEIVIKTFRNACLESGIYKHDREKVILELLQYFSLFDLESLVSECEFYKEKIEEQKIEAQT